MRSLVLRIYLTLVAVLLLFAALGGWAVQRQFEQEREAAREAARAALVERAAAWADLAQVALPPIGAPDADLQAALDALSARLRVALALEAEDGRRLATTAAFERRSRDAAERGGAAARVPVRLSLDDGRTLLVLGGGAWRHTPHGWAPVGLPPPAARAGGDAGLQAGPPHRPPGPSWIPFGPAGGLVLLLALLFVAVAAAAWPVARRLTRRLETLQRGVEAFGDGALGRRVAVEGRDEVSALARSFNGAADRIESLVGANRRLVANVSHEIRSPLARLKMAVAMLDGARDDGPAPVDPHRERLMREVHANIAELDALVDEVLLSSRLQAQAGAAAVDDPVVDLFTLALDEAAGARRDARAEGGDADGRWRLDGPAPPDSGPAVVRGDERLLRRALRNLLQNARRYGGDRATLALRRDGDDWVLSVTDTGAGVPEAERERIFEPFHRLPGHAEHQGSVGLGLSLVRQIAERHRGRAACDPAPGGGSVFSVRLPRAP